MRLLALNETSQVSVAYIEQLYQAIEKDYLLSLRGSKRINRLFSNMRGIREGDVVILKERNSQAFVEVD